jgi:hypothetical protein
LAERLFSSHVALLDQVFDDLFVHRVSLC